eukprot:8431194-Prorocentrum_lima.AAC.1
MRKGERGREREREGGRERERKRGRHKRPKKLENLLKPRDACSVPRASGGVLLVKACEHAQQTAKCWLSASSEALKRVPCRGDYC